MDLPLDCIEPDPENVRSEHDPQIVAGLKSVVETEGAFINPPTVYPIGQGRYRVKHGNTRLMAARGTVSSIRVRVVEPPRDETSKLLSQMGENLLQGSLRPADIGQALKRLRRADGRERSLGQLLGALRAAGIERTKSWVAMHLALAELAPEVQRLINHGALGSEVAYQLRALPHAEQIAWAQRIVDEGITLADLRRRLGAIGQAPPDERDGSPAELVQWELTDRLGTVSAEAPEAGQLKRRPAEAGRSNSAVSRRWDLLPVSLEENQQPSNLEQPATAAWVRRASAQQRELAHEAVFLGGCSPEEATELVDSATREAQLASEFVLVALNALRNLLEHPTDLSPHSALARFTAIRMHRVLRNIGA